VSQRKEFTDTPPLGARIRRSTRERGAGVAEKQVHQLDAGRHNGKHGPRARTKKNTTQRRKEIEVKKEA